MMPTFPENSYNYASLVAKFLSSGNKINQTGYRVATNILVTSMKFSSYLFWSILDVCKRENKTKSLTFTNMKQHPEQFSFHPFFTAIPRGV